MIEMVKIIANGTGYYKNGLPYYVVALKVLTYCLL